MDKLGRLEVEQLKVTSTTPPADSGFYKIDETTMGVVGDLKFRHPKTGAMSSALTVTSTSAQGVEILDPRDGMPIDIAEIGKSYRENRLVATDYYPYLAYSENKTYRFAKKDASPSVVTRISLSDSTESAGIDAATLFAEDGTTLLAAGSPIQGVWAWDDYQLIQVADIATGKYHIYKSVDNFANCGANAPLYNDKKLVYSVGWNAGKTANAAGLSVMAQWSLARGKNARGEDLLVFGQYNVNSARTAGGSNDWSNVLCSRQAGDVGTWDVVLEANTAGTNFLRHCHAVIQDPYTLEFWIFYGDGATSGIYVWDGIRPIPANTPPSGAKVYKGWRGLDRFNTPTANFNPLQITTVQFTKTEVIAPVDHGYTTDRGIYSISRDLTKFDKIWDGATGGLPDGHAMYSSLICPITKTMLASTLIETSYASPTADYILWVFAATKSGNYRDWTRVARYALDTAATYGRSHPVFAARENGEILLGGVRGAGKNANSTSICRISGVFDSEIEEPVHPVYWIDPIAGSDTNSGYSPKLAWKTVNRALTGSRVSTASLVNIGPGVTDEGTSSYTIAADTATKPAQLNHPIWIRGVGRKASVVTGSNIAAIFATGATRFNTRWSSLCGVNLAAGNWFDTSSSAPLSISSVFRDCYFVTTGAGAAIRGASGTVDVAQTEANIGTNGQFLNAASAGTMQITLRASVARGGKQICEFQGSADSSLVVENVTAVGQWYGGIVANASAVNLPTVKNLVLDAAAPPVRDERTTKTSAAGLVEYNVGRSVSVGLVGGDTGSKTVASLGLIGLTGVPGPTSAVIGAGSAAAGPSSDVFGASFAAPKNAGAFA